MTNADDHRAVLDRFYAAFARGDGTTMAACYGPDARFDDPVFPGLRGDQPGAMWRMLTARSTGLELEVGRIEAADDRGSAAWVAHYRFGPRRRPVTNRVQSTFRFTDGLIAAQLDSFDFYRWSRQALGPVGLLLGWTPVLRSSVQRKARAGLDDFLRTQA